MSDLVEPFWVFGWYGKRFGQWPLEEERRTLPPDHHYCASQSSMQPTPCTPRHNGVCGLGTTLSPLVIEYVAYSSYSICLTKCGSYYVQMCCKEIGYFSRIYVLRYVFSSCAIRFARNINFQCNSIRGTTKLRPVFIKFGDKDY